MSLHSPVCKEINKWALYFAPTDVLTDKDPNKGTWRWQSGVWSDHFLRHYFSLLLLAQCKATDRKRRRENKSTQWSKDISLQHFVPCRLTDCQSEQSRAEGRRKMSCCCTYCVQINPKDKPHKHESWKIKRAYDKRKYDSELSWCTLAVVKLTSTISRSLFEITGWKLNIRCSRGGRDEDHITAKSHWSQIWLGKLSQLNPTCSRQERLYLYLFYL